MLPEPAMIFLTEAARQARVKLPDADSSLFVSGILDSFTLVDFVAILENECRVTVPDRDLRPENFDTLARIEDFVARATKA